jgi:hypothetical protein
LFNYFASKLLQVTDFCNCMICCPLPEHCSDAIKAKLSEQLYPNTPVIFEEKNKRLFIRIALHKSFNSFYEERNIPN